MNSPYTNFRQLLESLDSIETQDALVPHEDDPENNPAPVDHQQNLDEDLIQQLTQEYADFLRDKPVADEAKSSKPKTRAQHNDTPEKRKQQGRCVSCGQSLSTAGRGTADRCKECSN